MFLQTRRRGGFSNVAVVICAAVIDQVRPNVQGPGQGFPFTTVAATNFWHELHCDAWKSSTKGEKSRKKCEESITSALAQPSVQGGGRCWVAGLVVTGCAGWQGANFESGAPLCVASLLHLEKGLRQQPAMQYSMLLGTC